MRVSQLIVNGCWDLSSIDSKISMTEREKILKIPIPACDSADRVIWLANKDGCYSVKFGYTVARINVEEEKVRDPGTSFSVSKSLWKNIWHTIVPPKIHHFLWRLGVGAIATEDSLFKRKCAKDPICPVCLAERETIEHLLFLCPWTKLCWFGSPLGLKFSKWSMRRIEEWLCDMLYGKTALDEYGKSLFAMMCWWIWKKRCNWVFREEKPDAKEVVKLVNVQVEEFWRARAKADGKRKRMFKEDLVRYEQWVAPPDGAIKINVDGSFKVASGEAGIGVVCRNSVGNFVGGMGRMVKAVSPFMVECIAMREALIHRIKFHNTQIIVETDCETLYRLMKNKTLTGCEWESWDLLKEIFGLLESMENVSLSLVSRQGNSAADKLAADAAKRMQQPLWLESAPSSLSNVLLHDVAICRGKHMEATEVMRREGIG